MQYFFLVISLTGYWLGAAVFIRVPFWFAPFFAMTSLMVGLYIAAICGVLYPVSLAIYIGGFGALLTSLPKFSLQKLDAAATVFLVVLLTASYVFVHRWIGKFEFLGWDEFSHWALVAKTILADDALFGSASNLQFKAYPPGTALIQYFFARFTANSEAAQLFGIYCLIVSAIMAATGETARKPVLALVFCALCILLAYSFGYSLYDVTVDHTLGFVMAAAATAAARSRRDLLIALPPIMALPLIKHVGLIFGAITAAILTCSYLWAQWETLRSSRRQFFAGVLPCVALAAGLAFSHFTWQAYVRNIGEVALYSNTLSISGAISFFFQPDDRSMAIWREFANRILNGNFASFSLAGHQFNVSMIGVYAMLAFASLLSVFLSHAGSRINAGIASALLFLGSFAYLGVLLLSYRSYFSAFEGSALVSFERYFGSYLLAWAIVCLAILCRAVTTLTFSMRAIVTAAGCVMLLMAPEKLVRSAFRDADNRADYVASTMAFRHDVAGVADVIKRNADRNSSVYFIRQNDSGYGYLLFRYLVAPMKTNMNCWSLGKPYDKDDIYSCDKPFSEALKGYDFLAMYVADDRFWQDYGAYFPPESRGLKAGAFQIIFENGELSRVEPLK